MEFNNWIMKHQFLFLNWRWIIFKWFTIFSLQMFVCYFVLGLFQRFLSSGDFFMTFSKNKKGGHLIKTWVCIYAVERIVLMNPGDNTSLRRLQLRRRRDQGVRLSKFRLNSPRINIRNGTPGCYKLACCPSSVLLETSF